MRALRNLLSGTYTHDSLPEMGSAGAARRSLTPPIPSARSSLPSGFGGDGNADDDAIGLPAIGCCITSDRPLPPVVAQRLQDMAGDMLYPVKLCVELSVLMGQPCSVMT